MWAKGDILVLVNPWEGCKVPTGSTAMVVKGGVYQRDDWCSLNWDDQASREHYPNGSVYGNMSGWFEKVGGPW